MRFGLITSRGLSRIDSVNNTRTNKDRRRLGVLGHVQPHLGSKVHPETMVQALEYILTAAEAKRGQRTSLLDDAGRT